MGAGLLVGTLTGVDAMAGLLMLAVLCILIFSFLGEREAWDPEEGDGLLARVKKRREHLLRALKDMEFEHACGKLADEEFQALRREFKRRAIAASQELEHARHVRLRALAARGRGVTPAERQRIEALLEARAARPRPEQPAGGQSKEGAAT